MQSSTNLPDEARHCFFEVRTQKTYSQMDSGIGPNLPKHLLIHVYDESITHLNLHANNIESLSIASLDPIKTTRSTSSTHDSVIHPPHQLEQLRSNSNCIGDLTLDSVEVIDLSSNNLGSKNMEATCHPQNTSISSSSQPPPSLLNIVPNLATLNLSANNLVSLDCLGISTAKKMMVMSNLKSLNLSYNNIKVIPWNISICCPLLDELNLSNNNIQDLTNLNQLASIPCLHCFSIKSNPICCKDVAYREKVILKIPTLIKFDDLDILEEGRRNIGIFMNSTSNSTSVNMLENDDMGLCNVNVKSKLHVPLSNKEGGNHHHSQRIRRKANIVKKPESPDRIKNTIEKLSLSKLNKIEFEVQKLGLGLSKFIAVEQVEPSTTKQLRNLRNHSPKHFTEKTTKESFQKTHESKRLHEMSRKKSLEKLHLVCDAIVQTDPSDLLEHNYHTNNESQMKFLSLAMALYRWKILTLKQKLRMMIENGKDERSDQVKHFLQEVMRQQKGSCANECKQTQTNEVSQTSLVQKECVSLKKKLEETNVELLNLKEHHDLEIRKIQSEIRLEAERFQTNLLMEFQCEQETMLHRQQTATTSKLISKQKELKHSLLHQTQNAKRLEKKVKKQLLKLEEYKANEGASVKKMNDLLKVMEIMKRRAVEMETKLDCSKKAIQAAAALARERGEECKKLQQQYNDVHNKFNITQAERKQIESERFICANELNMEKSLNEKKQKIIDEKSKLLSEQAIQIKELNDVIELEQRTNNKPKMQNSIFKMKNERKVMIKECSILKKRLIQKQKELEIANRQSLQNQHEIIELDEKSKNLDQLNGDLKEKLKQSDSRVCSLMKYIYELKSHHDYFQQKIAIDHEASLSATRDAVDKELSLRSKEIKKLQDELNATTSANRYMEERLCNLNDELDAEKKNKALLEKELKSIQQSSLARTKKAQKALQNICLGLNTNEV